MKASIDDDQTAQISAQIVKHDTMKVFIKIIDGISAFSQMYQKRLFDITFVMNRVTFQLQHNALKWIVKHSLFQILIDGPRFRVEESRTEPKYSI